MKSATADFDATAIALHRKLVRASRRRLAHWRQHVLPSVVAGNGGIGERERRPVGRDDRAALWAVDEYGMTDISYRRVRDREAHTAATSTFSPRFGQGG